MMKSLGKREEGGRLGELELNTECLFVLFNHERKCTLVEM